MKKPACKSEAARRFDQHEWNGTAEPCRSGIEAGSKNHLFREGMLSKLALDDAVHSSPGRGTVPHHDDLSWSERRGNHLHASTELPCHLS